MDMEIRLFIFAEDGTLLSLEKERFDRAVDHQEPVAEYSGQCVKLAGVLIDSDSGQVSQQNTFGQFVYFDEQGYVDEIKLNQSIRYSDKVTEQGYQNEFVWAPTAADFEKIKKAIG